MPAAKSKPKKRPPARPHGILVGTGHRPDKLGGFGDCELHRLIKEQIALKLARLQPTLVYSGMAVGFDTWLAQACVKLEFPFIAAVPFQGQEKVWPAHAQALYNWLLERAKEVVFVCEPGYDVSKLHRRNQWMVNKLRKPEDTLLACYNGDLYGGTYSTVTYARNNLENGDKFTIDIIDPGKLVVDAAADYGPSDDAYLDEPPF